MSTETKEKVAEAEFTATEAPTGNLPALQQPPLVRVLATVPKLAAALIKAQKQCRPVEKDSRNKYHGYNYASAEAIIAEGKTALNDNGLALMPFGSHVNGHEKEGEDRFELEREFVLMHESGEMAPIKCHWPVCPDKGRPLDKATAIADTLSLSYTYRDLLAMPRVDVTDDANSRDDTGKPAKGARSENGQKPAKGEEGEAPPDEPRIGEADLAELQRLIREHKPDMKALLARFKVKALVKLTAGQYQPAVQYIVGKLPVTEEQQQKIRAMIDEQKIPALTVKQRLHDLYRIESISQLARVQADDMIARLHKSKVIKNAPAGAGAA